jgi:ribonuclease D
MSRKISLTVDSKNVVAHLHKGDLPDDVVFNGAIAIDTETLGLSLMRDALCLVQLSDGGGEAHLVQMDRATYNAPNLKRVLTDVRGRDGRA